MSSWATLSNTIHGLKPTLIMILVQTILSLVNIGYKLAANDGMSLSILIAYRLIFGAASILPIAIVVERKKRPKLTWKIVLYGFLCGLLGGSLGQNLYLKSLVLTSATFASAMANLIPAVTFIIAASLRIERVGWSTSAGKAKVLGTLLGIGGAMLFTFYKGPDLNIGSTGINLLQTTSTRHPVANGPAHNPQGAHNLILGLLLALGSCVCYSLWLIIQAKAAEKYPCPYSFTAMINLWGSIQSTAYALGTERDWAQWALGWNIRLLAVVVAGVLGAGLMFTLVAWCIRMRGPLFVSTFNPLMLVMVAIAGVLFLEEKLYLGMVFGSILIILGLYMVLWGKGKEVKRAQQIIPENIDNNNHQVQELSSVIIDNDSIHRVSYRKEKGEEEIEERGQQSQRGSHASSSEILSSLYIYP
ncbi:nodulin MtN21 /EamA-like transporter family protein [Striga asiatica]|uniref:WAT1-related protein n=1 Tax=Striga asiatica TaxID=4170 RepID=A0A5A7RDN2_STRAF|nr:nodulin MtN21 /EamA-like transporter family protein [Striga asiatica]